MLKELPKIQILPILASFLTILASLPHPSSQRHTINTSSTVQATCIYSYDHLNRYSCELNNAVLTDPTDILVINGTHMPRHSDIDVEALIHRNASFAQFNGEALRKFVNLKFIELRRVQIDVINPNAFEVCGRLEELHMGFNGFMQGVPPGMLRNCHNLRIFWAPNLRALSLPEDLFGNSRNLEVFDMLSSPLRSFPDNLLSNMTNLRTFRIFGNYVNFLHPNNFLNAVNLQEFDIAWNNFSDTQHVMDILHGHLGLKKIIINFNYFQIFDFSFLSQFQFLEELAIGGRPQVTSISWQFLPTSLTSLTVDEVGENIAENSLDRLNNLRILRLSGTGITSFHPDTFKELMNLEELRVVRSNLASLHPQLFVSQSNLRILTLNDNQIEELPDGVFVPLISLGRNESTQGLNLRVNKITRLPISVFGQHPHLTFLAFSHNSIDEIERGLFSRFNQSMTQVGFGFNRCISRSFWDVIDTDEIQEYFQQCFDNFDGITTVPTTTPNGCGKFGNFELIFMVFGVILMNFIE
ncbi:carboxypeptidase N subunit 2-like [Chironomus tepperi]|uniref:carboxypeptidase N subunit 2-like n=1 Tax=Chironomus tepperi TaxID=113505 RepID=UPI00391F0EAB